MTKPRQVIRGATSVVERNCSHQEFLLNPDDEMNNAFLYCLAYAADKAGVDVITFVQMSNHLHNLIHDLCGHLPKFNEIFHGLLAKCGNAIRNNNGSFFEGEQVSTVHLESREDVIKQVVYIALNPVKAGAVARVSEWPGSAGYEAFMNDAPLTATRPKFFSRRMPKSMTLRLKLPEIYGDPEEFRREVRAAVEDGERAYAKLRRGNFLGAALVKAQSHKTLPKTPRRRRKLCPRFAGKNVAKRIQRLVEYKVFVVDHRKARTGFDIGRPVVFPYGSYLRGAYKQAPVKLEREKIYI